MKILNCTRKELRHTMVKMVISINVKPNDQVFLYNFLLQLFADKLCFIWSCPFTIKKIILYGDVFLRSYEGNEFTLNGQRVKTLLSEKPRFWTGALYVWLMHTLHDSLPNQANN